MTDESLAPVINDDAGEDFDVFDDSPEVEAEAETEVDETVEKAETEDKEEDSEEEAEEETTASEQKSVPVAALKDERKKRQDAEKEIEKLRQENESLKSKPEPIPDDKFSSLVEASADLMREEKEDYPEMEKIFMDLVTRVEDDKLVIKNLDLYDQYRASKNPAKFAYNHAKNHKANLEKSSPEYEETLRKRIEKEVLADLKKRKLIDAELPNLTSTAASGKNTDDPEAAGPDDGVWDD